MKDRLIFHDRRFAGPRMELSLIHQQRVIELMSFELFLTTSSKSSWASSSSLVFYLNPDQIHSSKSSITVWLARSIHNWVLVSIQLRVWMASSLGKSLPLNIFGVHRNLDVSVLDYLKKFQKVDKCRKISSHSNSNTV